MRLFAIAALTLALGAGPAFAADPPAKPLTPQQQKMKDCNAQATGKTGDERKTFMSTCLSSSTDAAPAKPMTQQERMTACNAKATGKTGDDRKAFMSNCLKADSTTAAKPMTQQEKMTACNAKATGKTGDDRKAFMSECLKGDGSGAPASH